MFSCMSCHADCSALACAPLEGVPVAEYDAITDVGSLQDESHHAPPLPTARRTGQHAQVGGVVGFVLWALDVRVDVTNSQEGEGDLEEPDARAAGPRAPPCVVDIRRGNRELRAGNAPAPGGGR